MDSQPEDTGSPISGAAVAAVAVVALVATAVAAAAILAAIFYFWRRSVTIYLCSMLQMHSISLRNLSCLSYNKTDIPKEDMILAKVAMVSRACVYVRIYVQYAPRNVPYPSKKLATVQSLPLSFSPYMCIALFDNPIRRGPRICSEWNLPTNGRLRAAAGSARQQWNGLPHL